MGFKIKNSLTGEFEKLPILTLKGEKGETGGVEEYNKVDYMGNKYETLKQANDANVEYAVKTAIGEFNYLDYDGQHITATDTIEGQSKNATLTGQTLVNLATITERFALTDGWNNLVVKLNYPLSANAKYLINVFNLPNDMRYVLTNRTSNSNWIMPSYVNGKTVFTSQCNSDAIITLHVNDSSTFRPLTQEEINKIQVILIEYQEGMENWDIPYFTGMQSVKMPVLTTVGKNLFNPTKMIINDGALYGYYKYKNDESVRCTLSISDKDTSVDISNLFLGVSKTGMNASNGYDWLISNGTITRLDAMCIITNFNFISIYPNNIETLNKLTKRFNIQIEYGEVKTSYEPFKSNILTVNEPVELRGIGDVKDELNLLTGELTQRIDEIDFNTLQFIGWKERETTARFSFTYSFNRLDQVICNNYPVKPNVDWSIDTIGIENGYNDISIAINKSELSEISRVSALNFINNKGIRVCGILKTPNVKTVDLSDNHVYSHKGITHYDCSSTDGSLVPTLSVKVPTDVQATIAQQRETIQTLNSENERLNQIQETLKASMLDSQVQLMNLSWDIDFEVFALRESIAPKDSLMDSKTGSNIDKFSQAKFIIENDCPDLEKLNSQIEYYFSKDVFSQEQFEELTDLISIVKGENGCEY